MRDRSTPMRSKIFACRYSGSASTYFEVTIWASSDALAKPLGIGCTGGVVAADLLVFGNVVEDFFAGQEIRKRLPTATLLARVGGDFDGGLFADGFRFLAQHFSLVEQPHLVGGRALALRSKALTLQQPDVFVKPAHLFAVFNDRLFVLRRFFLVLRGLRFVPKELLRIGIELSLLRKHQRPQIFDGTGKTCGCCGHDG